MAVDLDSGVALRLNFVTDRVYKYTLTTDVHQEVKNQGKVVNHEDNVFKAALEQRVIRVESDGSAHIVCVTQPEQPSPQGPPRQVIYQYSSPLGTILETSGPNPGNSYSFPDHPVREGETWEGESRLPVPGRVEPLIGSTRYEMTGIEEVGGRECARIEITTSDLEFDLPMPDRSGLAKVTMQSQGVMHFDPQDGLVVRMEITTHSSPRVGPLEIESSNVIVQELEGIEDRA